MHSQWLELPSDVAKQVQFLKTRAQLQGKLMRVYKPVQWPASAFVTTCYSFSGLAVDEDDEETKRGWLGWRRHAKQYTL